MFATCCCSDKQGDEVTLSALNPGGAGPYPYAHDDEHVDGDLAPWAQAEPPMTEEEHAAERARLQETVSRFAQRAVSGFPCTYVREVTGEVVRARYQVTRSLQSLVIVADSQPELECPVADIQDIYSCLGDGESVFPREVLTLVQPHQRDLLLMVVYTSEDGHPLRFCLLEDTPESRDNFLECMRVLVVYAQAKDEDGTGDV
mmetsp:Transcript_11869/g.31350  ORF Transcript_11869/g.31350 Transcript_11869/m.31350 type:complete len:202 (-) Transcript_11869:8-613(-)